jgi:outer membrane protein assembly factor BamB
MKSTARTLRIRYVFAILALIGAISPAWSYELVSEYIKAIDDNDRILGSLRDNYLIYNRGYMALYNATGTKVFDRKINATMTPTMSDNGKFLGLVTYAGSGPNEFKTARLDMLDLSGKVLWTLKDPVANRFIIADNGSIYGIEGVEGMSPTRIHLYDRDGDRNSIVPVNNYHGLTIAPSCGRFLVDRALDGLDIYDTLGTLVGSLPTAKNYRFDRDDRYIATFFNGTLRLYQDLKEVMTITSSEIDIEDMAIDVKTNRAVLLAAKRLEVFELTTGKKLWEFPLLKEEEWFSSLDLSADGQRIVCGMDINLGTLVAKEKRHVEGYVYLFPIGGQTMASRKVTYGRWGVGMPRVVFSTGGGAIMMETRSNIEKFRIK